MAVSKDKMKTIVGFVSSEVFERAKAEPNTSALVEALLANHYGIELPTDSVQAQMRHQALKPVETTEVVSEPVKPDIASLIGGSTNESSVANLTPADAPGTVAVGDTSSESVNQEDQVEEPTPALDPDHDDYDPADGDIEDEFLKLDPKPTPLSNDFADLGPAGSVHPGVDTGVTVQTPEPEKVPSAPPAPVVPEIPFQPIAQAQATAVAAEPTLTPIDPASGALPTGVAQPMVEPVQEEAPQYNAGDKVCPSCGKNFAPLPFCLDCL